MEPRSDGLRLAELQRRLWSRGNGRRGTSDHAAAAINPLIDRASDTNRRPVEFADGWVAPVGVQIP
jgi:hypothetical protein